MTTTIYQGARDPERLDLVVTDSAFDLSAVTSVELEVKDPINVVVAWTWAIVAQSSASITLRHSFAVSGADVPRTGVYTIRGWVVTPSTRRRILPARITALEY